MVKTFKSIDEFKQVTNSGKPVLIDFTATWCGPCKVMSPIFEKLSAQYNDVEFYKVDVDEQSDISEEVGIRAMPTFMLFSNGTKVDELVGASPDKLNTLVSKGVSLL